MNRRRLFAGASIVLAAGGGSHSFFDRRTRECAYTAGSRRFGFAKEFRQSSSDEEVIGSFGLKVLSPVGPVRPAAQARGGG